MDAAVSVPCAPHHFAALGTGRGQAAPPPCRQLGLTCNTLITVQAVSKMSPGRQSNGKAELFQSHSSWGVREGGALGVL